MVLQQQQQPPWLFDLLDAEFECVKGQRRQNSFCITCKGNAISKKEGERHQGMGHNVIEVMKCSGYYSLKAADVERLSLDSSDIHVFIINHKDIIFLNSRQHGDKIEKRNRGNKCCTVCGWTLDAGLFCSLGCKFRKHEGKVSRMEHKESGDGDIGTHIPIPTTKRQRTERTKKPESRMFMDKSRWRISMDREMGNTAIIKKNNSKTMDEIWKLTNSDYGIFGFHITIPKRPRTMRIWIDREETKGIDDDDDDDGGQQWSQPAEIISFRTKSRKGEPIRSPLSSISK